MKDLRLMKQFKRDLKRADRRGLDLRKLNDVVELLREDQPLSQARKDHALKGDYEDCRECHLQPDWLLIYQSDDEEVVLVRTGSHADLFE